MESKRQKQVAKLIQKELGDIFQKNSSWVNNQFVTITVVRVSGDLSLVKVYLSFLMVDDEKALLQEIQENAFRIRQELARRLRHQFRKMPELAFHLDDTQEEASRIEKLLDDLDIPPTDEDNEEV